PLPAHVLPVSSRYLTGTVRPLRGLPPTFILEPVSLERSSLNCAALRVRTCSTSARSFSNASTDIALMALTSPERASVDHTALLRYAWNNRQHPCVTRRADAGGQRRSHHCIWCLRLAVLG